jgi:hypothetical protein
LRFQFWLINCYCQKDRGRSSRVIFQTSLRISNHISRHEVVTTSVSRWEPAKQSITVNRTTYIHLDVPTVTSSYGFLVQRCFQVRQLVFQLSTSDVRRTCVAAQSRSSKSRWSSESTSWSKSLVIIWEIGPERGIFHSYSKCHVLLRAEDDIIVGKMLELIPSRSMISTKQSQCNIQGKLRSLRILIREGNTRGHAA